MQREITIEDPNNARCNIDLIKRVSYCFLQCFSFISRPISFIGFVTCVTSFVTSRTYVTTSLFSIGSVTIAEFEFFSVVEHLFLRVEYRLVLSLLFMCFVS
jgi:hypothetical protein